MWLFVSNSSGTGLTMSNARTYPGVSRQSLITKTATVVRKEKAQFSHYGMLHIEWYCANGIPMDKIVDVKDSLIGPSSVSAPLVRQRRLMKMASNPKRYTFQKSETCDSGNPAPKDRIMTTWPPHTMLTHMLADAEVLIFCFLFPAEDYNGLCKRW
jgi:hypothetical protein